MSWRSSAERELRTRVSPELVAGILVVVVALALIGILGIAQTAGTEPSPGGSTAAPSASASRDPAGAGDTTIIRSVLLLDERIDELGSGAGAVQAANPSDASVAAAISPTPEHQVASRLEVAISAPGQSRRE